MGLGDGTAGAALELADLLRDQRGWFVEEWTRLALQQPVAPGLSVEAFQRHLSTLLEGIAAGLSEGAAGRPVDWRERKELRPLTGLTHQEVVIGYGLLRKVLLRKLAADLGRVVPRELEQLNEALDYTIAQAAAEPSQAEVERSLLRLIIEQSGDAIIMADEQGILRVFNPEAERIHGATLHEVAGPEWARRYGLTTVEGRPMQVEEVPLYRALQGEEIRNERMGIRHPDGKLRLISCTAMPLRRADGSRAGAVLAARDETARLALERERGEMLALLDSILDTAPVGLGFLDRDLRYVRLNPLLAELNGIPVEQTLGRTLREVIPRMAPWMEPLFRSVFETGTPVLNREMEGRMAAPDQGRHWLVSFYPVRGRDGQVFLVGAVLVEITERKRAEETQRFFVETGRLLAGSLDYATTLKTIGRLVVSRLADYCIIDVFDEGGELRRLVVEAADPARQPLLDRLLAFPPLPGSNSAPARVLDTGEPLLIPEFTPATLDNIVRNLEHRAMYQGLGVRSMVITPMVTHGRRLGLLSFASVRPQRAYGPRDLELAMGVADRAAVAIENARLYQQAQQAIQTREDVLAIVSHDLRNPVNAIQMSTGLMFKALSGSAAGTRLLQHAQAIHRASERMKRLIGDLLDYASLEAGTFAVEPRACAAKVILEEALEMMLPLAHDKEIRLELEARGLEDAGIRCDRGRLLQVFSNVVGNALKFSPEGATVVLAGRREPGEVWFEVRDSGPGIPATQLPHVFDRYWKAERSGTRGTGLGLYIAKRVIALHGGRIWVASEEGKGAAFFFTVPLSEHQA